MAHDLVALPVMIADLNEFVTDFFQARQFYFLALGIMALSVFDFQDIRKHALG